MMPSNHAAALLLLGVATVALLARVESSNSGRAASSCGFIGTCVPLLSQRSGARGVSRMALSEEMAVPIAASTPSADLPAASSSSASSDKESTVGNPGLRSTPPGTAMRGPVSSGVNAKPQRRAEPPPSVETFQTTNQRRRARPLSKLKRVKPKSKRASQDEGEFRPLVAKTDRESVLRGEDYWIDYRELDAKRARKQARAKAPAPDQFAQSKMKAEIVNPYKQNWILVISIAITAIAAFIKVNPDVLNDAAISTFPTEL